MNNLFMRLGMYAMEFQEISFHMLIFLFG